MSKLVLSALKVAIYSPYLDTFGGGERYVLTAAEILSQANQVDLLIDKHLARLHPSKLLQDLAKRFHLDLSKVQIKDAPVGKNSSFVTRLFFLRKYDALFYLTDGSIFYSTAKRSLLHIQSPLIGQPAMSFWGRVKLSSWEKVIYNSNFTKSSTELYWPLRSEVVYPPIDTAGIKFLKKKKYILSVGRFFGFLKEKKHQLMIQVFSDLVKERKISGWSLHLVGSMGEGDESYLNSLKNQAAGLPIYFYPNLEHQRLVELYGESSIYWHAMGFGEADPAKVEHFGIATVEAMAGGCAPVVIKAGGQKEIVEDKVSGFLWGSVEELKEYTTMLVEDPILRQGVSRKAAERAKIFDQERFKKKILALFTEGKHPNGSFNEN